MPKLIKKILLIYISIVLTFAPSSVFAASAGGWAFSGFDFSTGVVTALKGGASASVAVAKSPITSKIAKGIAGGVIAGAAIPLAISQISGIALNAVDWVFDSANNAIKYKDTGSAICASNLMLNNMTYSQAVDSIKSQVEARSSQSFAMNYEGVISVTCAEGRVTIKVKRSWCTSGCAPGVVYTYGGAASSTEYIFSVTGKNNNSDTYKTIPISSVTDKIYDNAKTDSASASIVNDAVKDYVNSGAADVALDAAKADADATHNCGTGTHWSGSACVADTPSTPSTPTTPDTPFDPSSILDAIGKVFDAVMSLPDVINNALDSLLVDIKDFFEPVITKVTDMVDWFKSDPDPQTDTKPDIDTTPPTKSAQDFDSNYINFGGQCPSFSPTTISVGIVAVPISFNAQPLCDFAILCRPIILALAYFAAMAIVANAIRSE